MTAITYTEFNSYIDTLAADYKYSGHDYFGDYCHECADSSEHVIYYGLAWDLVNMLRGTDRSILDDAESALFDSGFDMTGETIDSVMCKLAYECIYQQLSLAIQEQEAA